MTRKKIFISTGISIIMLSLVFTSVGFLLIDYSLRPENRGKDLKGSLTYMQETYPQINSWLDSLQQNNAMRDTFITAPDGIRLHAYYAYASQPTSHTAIIIHGYTDNAIRMFHIGYLYNKELDFNILLPDLRYSGLSEGNTIQMGWLDRKDVLQWIDTMPSLFGNSLESVVHGISMGAATTMMVSGERVPPFIRCFIEDCGYTSVWDQFQKEFKGLFHIPSFPWLNIASWICKKQNGWNFKEASAIKQIQKCTLPMLFIHGDNDDFVPTAMVYQLYDAKPQPKELWIAPETDHAHAYRNHPKEYTEKVKTFVEKYLGKN